MSSWGNSPGATAFIRTPSGPTPPPATSSGCRQRPWPRRRAPCGPTGEGLGGAGCSAIGPPATRAGTRRWSSWLQKKVPSITMRATARKAFGLHGLGQHGEVRRPRC